ncbi:ABC transporter substrate-binding protein, partial [Thermodesulfobacteriota bacterium]
MKRIVLVVVVIILAGTFTLGISIQNSMAAEKGNYGGIFKFNQGKGASRFGVPLNIRHADRFYGGFFVEPLIRFTEKQNEYIPQLATSWELSPDRKHFTFHLRKGVKFHDGSDFNAQAVKWNLDKVPPDPRPVLDNVSSIDVIDDHTIRFNLTSWDSLFLNTLLWDACLIISPTSYEKNGENWANTHPVGTGPWKLESHKRNIMMKLEKFDDYYEKGIPYFDGIEITMIPDAMTAMASFKRRDIDCLYQIDVISASELKATGKYNIGSALWNRSML